MFKKNFMNKNCKAKFISKLSFDLTIIAASQWKENNNKEKSVHIYTGFCIFC